MWIWGFSVPVSLATRFTTLCKNVLTTSLIARMLCCCGDLANAVIGPRPSLEAADLGTSTSYYTVALREQHRPFLCKWMSDGLQKFPEISSMSRRATCNLQGGAIYGEGAVLEIYDSAFIGNTADYVSPFCSCYLVVL
jgi:hypothetical protein